MRTTNLPVSGKIGGSCIRAFGKNERRSGFPAQGFQGVKKPKNWAFRRFQVPKCLGGKPVSAQNLEKSGVLTPWKPWAFQPDCQPRKARASKVSKSQKTGHFADFRCQKARVENRFRQKTSKN